MERNLCCSGCAVGARPSSSFHSWRSNSDESPAQVWFSLVELIWPRRVQATPRHWSVSAGTTSIIRYPGKWGRSRPANYFARRACYIPIALELRCSEHNFASASYLWSGTTRWLFNPINLSKWDLKLASQQRESICQSRIYGPGLHKHFHKAVNTVKFAYKILVLHLQRGL